MRIGVTGHQSLEEPSQWEWVQDNVRRELSDVPELVGISCLAGGSDQVFAREVLRANGTLVAILPFPTYEETFDSNEALEGFRHLRDAAIEVVVLPSSSDWEESFLKAGKEVVLRSERLLAIWNGLPSRGKGGTADIVDFAATNGLPIQVLDPVAREVRSK